MPVDRRALLRWQLDLTWSLLDYHLERLEADDLLWEPATLCWTLHRGPDGTWVPDWAEAEPDPIPVPTIGWITWHLGWWWTVTIDHARGRTPTARTDVVWPGEIEGTVAWLRSLHADWLAVLEDLSEADLEGPASFPWPLDDGRTIAHMAGWVNAELMKNTAEIGNLRLLRAAR